MSIIAIILIIVGTFLVTSTIWLISFTGVVKFMDKEITHFRNSWIEYHERWIESCRERSKLEKTIQQLQENTPDCGACAEGFWCGSVSHKHTCGKPDSQITVTKIDAPEDRQKHCEFENHYHCTFPECDCGK